jgi:DNA-binding NtrC family response regulator
MDKLLVIGMELADDADVERLVKHEGYEVLEAAGREEGLGLFRAERPAVVILDDRIGEDSGVGLLRELREEDPSSEVILVTSGGDMEVAVDALRAGALDYLRRPIDRDQLRLALGRARDRRGKRTAPEPPALLVLEDYEPTRKRLVQALEKEGYRVYAAGDGEEGMRVFAEKRVDLILADLMMPQKDGLAVLRDTKGKGADVEVIVVTGYGDEDVVVQALREGAINFLKKPIDIEQMLLAIEKALEHQTIRRSLAFKDRDIELMEELVVRLTRKLELVVETPKPLSVEAFSFLSDLVDALPFGVVVTGPQQEVIFANRHVTDKVSPAPTRLEADWLRVMGITGIQQERLDEAFAAVLASKPGTIETVLLSKWAFLVMTPLTLVRPNSTDRFIAVAIRGERGSGG